jgi:hypothetical protein
MTPWTRGQILVSWRIFGTFPLVRQFMMCHPGLGSFNGREESKTSTTEARTYYEVANKQFPLAAMCFDYADLKLSQRVGISLCQGEETRMERY